MNPIVPRNSSTGIPLSTCTFLKYCSAITGFVPAAVAAACPPPVAPAYAPAMSACLPAPLILPTWRHHPPPRPRFQSPPLLSTLSSLLAAKVYQQDELSPLNKARSRGPQRAPSLGVVGWGGRGICYCLFRSLSATPSPRLTPAMACLWFPARTTARSAPKHRRVPKSWRRAKCLQTSGSCFPPKSGTPTRSPSYL